MNIEIICIGALKESYFREAEKEYLKRLAPYCKVSVTELRETRLPKDAGKAEEENVRRSEGSALITAALLAKGGGTAKRKESSAAYVFALDMRGRQQSSEKFAENIQKLALGGKSTFVFLIGGSLGLSEAVREGADAVLSFSELTFPHQLMRVILLEQLYRAQKILRGEPYHK